MGELLNKPEIKALTMREIILTIQDYVREVLKNYFVLIFVFLPFMGFYIYKYYTTKPEYYAEVKFLVEGSSSSTGGLGGLLGQFGIRNTGKANPFKIVEVAKSKAIIEEVLFSKYDNELVANHIIELYELSDEWGKNEPQYLNFKFKHTKYSEFDSLEKTAFVRLINKVTGGKEAVDYMINFTFNNETGIYSYQTNSINEKMAIHLQDASYESLRKFFEEDMVENSIKTSIVLKQKADSLQNMLVKKTYQLASIQDRSLGLVLATPGVKKMTLEKEIQALTLAYSEVLKSYELSDINLKDTKPLFLKLDESLSPLDSTAPSLVINLIKAILLTVLFGAGFIIMRKLYREIMQGTEIIRDR